MTPEPELRAVRAATDRLLSTLDSLSPVDLVGPSLLPGWTRAHVVAHLAGNARSHVRMLAGCLAGEVRTQYAEGAPGRAAEIEALAADPPAAQAAVRASADELEQCWRRMTEQHWSGQVQPLDARAEPAPGLLWSRHREVEVHHVDLAAGYGPRDWPASFLDRLLDDLLQRDDLPSLTGIHGPRDDLAAWLAGRSRGERLTGRLPDLPEWR